MSILATLMPNVVLMVVVYRTTTAGRHGGFRAGMVNGFDPLNYRFEHMNDMWRNERRRVEQLLDVRVSWLERDRRAERRRDAGDNPR